MDVLTKTVIWSELNALAAYVKGYEDATNGVDNPLVPVVKDKCQTLKTLIEQIPIGE